MIVARVMREGVPEAVAFVREAGIISGHDGIRGWSGPAWRWSVVLDSGEVLTGRVRGRAAAVDGALTVARGHYNDLEEMPGLMGGGG